MKLNEIQNSETYAAFVRDTPRSKAWTQFAIMSGREVKSSMRNSADPRLLIFIQLTNREDDSE